MNFQNADGLHSWTSTAGRSESMQAAERAAAERAAASDYAMRVFWSAEDAEYVATFDAFPGVSAPARSPSDAAEEALKVLDSILNDMREDGAAMPEPDKAAAQGGRITLRLPRSLHGTLSTRARQEGMSLNTFIVTALGPIWSP